MTLFQLDGGRPQVANSVAPADVAHGANLVDDHLGLLLGEHLLPVRTREGNEDDPYLLAVDVLGRPVVVEVVGLLDGTSLLRALAYLGRAARLSLRDLAQDYHRGPERFLADLASFRESVPAMHLGVDRSPVRLLLVCGQVAPGVGDAVTALADRGVEVLRVGALDGPQGRFVEVSPVRGAAVEDAQTLNAAATVTGSVSSRTDRDPGSRRVAVVRDDASEAPVPDEDSESRVPRHARSVERASADHREDLAEPPVQEPDRRAALRSRSSGAERLARAARNGPVVLVWPRHRRGQTLGAILRPNGIIELADGTQVDDPTRAAELVSGRSGVDGWQVWRVGGDGGPSLGEVCRNGHADLPGEPSSVRSAQLQP